jgi:DNA-binding transcriptional LysR family regulator
VTPEGEIYLERCRAAVLEMEGGREALAEVRAVAKGPLTVTMPVVLGRLVVPHLVRLVTNHPRITLDFRVSDRVSGIGEEGIDVALRTGKIAGEGLTATRIPGPTWVTVAAPSYLARHGKPQRPEDLAHHACLKFVVPRGVNREWTYGGASVATPTRFRIDHGELLIDAAESGLGIAQAYDFMVEKPIREGRLTKIMEDLESPGPPIHAVYLTRRKNSPKVRIFLDLIEQIFGLRAPQQSRLRVPSRASE